MYISPRTLDGVVEERGERCNTYSRTIGAHTYRISEIIEGDERTMIVAVEYVGKFPLWNTAHVWSKSA